MRATILPYAILLTKAMHSAAVSIFFPFFFIEKDLLQGKPWSSMYSRKGCIVA